MTVTEAVTLIAAVTSAIVAIGGVAISWRNAGKVDAVHTLVNGQSQQLQAIAHTAGVAEGAGIASSIATQAENARSIDGGGALPPQ
jgi:hypothetical protein